MSINEQTLTGVTVFENKMHYIFTIPEKKSVKGSIKFIGYAGMSISNACLPRRKIYISTRDIPAAIYIAEIIYEGQNDKSQGVHRQ